MTAARMACPECGRLFRPEVGGQPRCRACLLWGLRVAPDPIPADLMAEIDALAAARGESWGAARVRLTTGWQP